MYRFQDRLLPFTICHSRECYSAAAVFVMLLLWSNVCLAESKVRYTVIDIGTLGAECYPTGMNSKGHITGISRITAGSPWRAFLWRDGTLEDIGSLGNDTQAAAINDADEIAGTYRRDFQSGTEDHYFLLHAFKWTNGTMTNLGTLGGRGSYGHDINNSGVVVGESEVADSSHLAAYSSVSGSMQDLNIDPARRSSATGINNAGQIVGWKDAPGGGQEGWLFAGGVIPLGSLGGGGTVPRDINDQGAVVGSSLTSGFTQHAFLWQNGVMTDLGGISTAVGINDSGDIIGNGSGSAFVYEDDLVWNLDSLIDRSTGWRILSVVDINDSGMIVGRGRLNGKDRAILLRPLKLGVTKPTRDMVWIAGQKDTIKWVGGKKDQVLAVDYSLDSGKTFSLLDFVGSADTGIYVWTPPRDFLFKKCFIRIADFNDQTKADTSDLFRIKPYMLTRDSSGQYEPFRPEEDQWGFWNRQIDMFPPVWHQQFNYQGIDPFTNSQFSQWQGNFAFASAISAEYPDWVSWVHTFGIDACYVSTTLGIYSPSAVLRWDACNSPWRGSCFGLATSNALAFSYKGQFHTTFPSFPVSANPITAPSDSGAKTAIHELYTHQFGKPHSTYRSAVRGSKTPTETLNEIKQMLTNDHAGVRVLCLENNGGSGAHGILAYAIDKDAIVPDVYYVRVYDNSYPTSMVRIWINTSAGGGKGSWSYANLPGWGGVKYLYLYDPAVDYFDHPALPKPGIQQSPFALGAGELEIFTPVSASTRIADNAGKMTGFYDNTIHEDIPGSTPLIPVNGRETPPYGYALPAGSYSVLMDSLTTDTVKTFFFTGNRIVSYRRSGATPDQTDRLFFDGGVAVANPDQQTKTVSLTTVSNETTREKLFALNSIELSQNDSVKIEQPDSNTIRLISHGTAKDYDIELNYVTGSGIGKFGTENIPLSANTTHSIAPDWENVTTGTLRILVDRGNDGTIDDTLSLQNRLTGTGSREEPVIPGEYRLDQNYPNPFNPSTTIRFGLPERVHVTLTVFNTLGQQVAVLVEGEVEAGFHEVTFTASHLASGVYLYQLRAGAFVETRKLMIVR